MPNLIFLTLPDPEGLLTLSPEELAGVVLDFLCREDTNGTKMHRGNFTGPDTVAGYPSEYQRPIQQALVEAWVWLEREGLIAPRPGNNGAWVFVTRRGRQVENAQGLSAYRHATLLPRQLLHPSIAQKIWPPFIRGDYDTAVFQAFKEVEVAVRSASNLALSDFGVPLMRKAFHSATGPLTDKTLLDAERQATLELFAGAMGRYKNPQSHRNVELTDPAETIELLLLASHLLRIVGSRRLEE